MWSVISLLCLTILFTAGSFLVIDEEPKKVDAIIVLSGATGRLDEAMTLYQEGYSKNLILSNGQSFPFEELVKYRVPSSSIIFENQALSTLDNAVYTKDMMMQHQFHSAIVVSSDYHMKRVQYLFEENYSGTDIELVYKASKSNVFHPTWWWTSKTGIQVTVNEYLKLAGNAFGFHGPKAKEPLEFINRFLS